MSRKKKIPAPIVALVMATGQLTGVAALPAPAQAANPVAAAPAQGVIKQRSASRVKRRGPTFAVSV